VERGRIALAVDMHHRPIEISAFRWSSAASGWAGFPVECHVFGPHGKLEEFGTEHALVGLCVSGLAAVSVHEGKAERRMVSSPGCFSLLARGFEQKPAAWSGMRELICIAMDAGHLDRYLSHDPVSARLVAVEPQYAVRDPHVASIVGNMRDEILAGCPTGTMYGDALSLALAAYLLKRYSHRRASVSGCGHSLSPKQLQRVREYVRANLSRDLGLSELAEQVGLSPHYFSTLFKHALGVPPHRYVLSQRVREAKRLLSTHAPISDVANRLGFADQSHFSRVFRKMTGTTPKRFQVMR
jgi:AraC family transcriptional regulator